MDIKRMNILVVDDDQQITGFLSDGLKAMGHQVKTAHTALDGLELLNKESGQFPWDVMIADLNLPDHDGIWLLKEAKAVNPQMVVLIITGYGSVETAVETLQMGAVDYLQKPFKLETLKLKLERSVQNHLLSRENRLLKRDLALYRIYDLIVGTPDSNKLLQVTLQSLNNLINRAAIKIVLKDGMQVSNGEWKDDYELLALQASLEAKGVKYGMIYIKPLDGELDADQRTGLALLSRNVSLAVENITLATSLRETIEKLEIQRSELLDSYKYAVLGEISSSLVHEMRNPLSAITLGVEYFSMSLKGDDKLQKSLASISKSGERLNVILDNLSLYSKESKDTKSTVLISDILAKAVGLVNYYLAGKKVKINLDRGNYEKPVLVNLGQIQQALVDILVFQGKRLAKGGEIGLSIVQHQDDMAIEIYSPSLIIPPDELREITEPNSSSWRQGFDLSVCLARRLLGENNCLLDVASSQGRGTMIRILFDQNKSIEVAGYGQAN